MTPYPTALTIAGSDSGGGAGVQADLKTFLDHRVFGMSAIAAITAQNSRGVTRVDPVPPEGLHAQLQAVFDDFPVGAVKIGMLGSAAHVSVVARFLAGLRERPPVVLDPVMVASTGHRLLEPRAEEVLVRELLPLATITTPNLEEAAVLAGAPGLDAAIAWASTAPAAVLITGGDPPGWTAGADRSAAELADHLVDAGHPVRQWRHLRVGVRPFHGTGCTLASAIAARLAHGRALPDAVDGAIGYVQALIRAADELGSIGQGNPSLPHGLA
ncbi:MAG: bifunctional hydroxymethylpyrimidine kinase/phosphomethylpyrimidine kinase [Myxococcota bacterium]